MSFPLKALSPGLVVLGLWLLQRFILGEPWYGIDDAYIYIHNAQVLHWGFDPNYGDVSPLEGTTSAIFLAALWALMFVLPALWALDLISVACAIGYITGVAHLCRVTGCKPIVTALVCAGALLIAQMPHHLMNGMETGLMLATVTWALALSLEPDNRRSWVLALLCGSMPFIRPDIVPIGALLLLRSIFRSNRVTIARDIALATFIALPWAVWFWIELRSPLPSTMEAKHYFFVPADWSIGNKAWMVGIQTAAFTLEAHLFLIGLALVLFYADPLMRVVLGAFLAIFFAAYTVELPNVFVSYQYRYYYPLIPWCIAGFAIAMGNATPLTSRPGAVLTAALTLAIVAFPWHWGQYLELRTYAKMQLDGLAEWVNANLPPDSTLLIHDAGYIAYDTKFSSLTWWH